MSNNSTASNPANKTTVEQAPPAKPTASFVRANAPDGSEVSGPHSNENVLKAIGGLAGCAAGAVRKVIDRGGSKVGGWVTLTYFEPDAD